MAVTVRGTDILFNDGTTQSTAASSAKFDATDSVGSIMPLHCTYNTGLNVGSSISGSYLFRRTSGVPNTSNHASASWGNYLGNLGYAVPPAGDLRNRTSAFSFSGAGTSFTFSPMSGTWRLLIANVLPIFDGYYSTTQMWTVLAIRIA